MGWYAVYLREMLLLWKKIGRLGYVFSSIISPFIYLFAFGYGLGNRVSVPGGYLPFLAAGIVGITVMMNSFQQTSSSISTGKLYFRIFQSLVLCPVRKAEVILGIVLAGMARGVMFGALIFLMAWLVFDAALFTTTSLAGAILGSFCFSSLGVIVGLAVKHPDDVSMVNNFFIMPMTFFGGSFFPLDSLPEWLRVIASLFPIGSLNVLFRTPVWDVHTLTAALLLFGLGLAFFLIGVWMFTNYSE